MIVQILIILLIIQCALSSKLCPVKNKSTKQTSETNEYDDNNEFDENEYDKFSAINEEIARIYMSLLNKETAQKRTQLARVSWNYEINITKENLIKKIEIGSQTSEWSKKQWEKIILFPWKTFIDIKLRRQFLKYAIVGPSALPDDKHKHLIEIEGRMTNIYSTAQICSYCNPQECGLTLEPDIQEILSNSDDEEELRHTWDAWRNVTGKHIKQYFEKYVKLQNEAAVLNNFSNTAEYWLYSYEDPNFRDEIERIWRQLQPLYLQLHAHVRHQLGLKYGKQIVREDDLIPAHLLGSIWSQNWENVYKYMVPYPLAESPNITVEMKTQRYTPLKMFKVAEHFFKSINLTSMPQEFWRKSIIEKPKSREINCHISAWDFCDQKNFRIKQCTEINWVDFIRIHHEMGHIEYQMQYKNQEVIFRSGANPGFHEAIADLVGLSVDTDKYLNKIGLVHNYVASYETTINTLFKMALDKIAFLPFAYIMDLWRWRVFEGNITSEYYNTEWWRLVEDYQGIQAPSKRTEKDFDPGAMYHTVAGLPFIRYFVAIILKFQFHKALCELAGQYEPNNPDKALHKCSIYGSKQAGNALSKIMQLGSSKPWQDAMESLTGSRTMDASALLEYFEPLLKWLISQNDKNGQYIGWEPADIIIIEEK